MVEFSVSLMDVVLKTAVSNQVKTEFYKTKLFFDVPARLTIMFPLYVENSINVPRENNATGKLLAKP